MSSIPATATVTDPTAQRHYATADLLREQIKEVGRNVMLLASDIRSHSASLSEVNANAMLAYRHIEDCSMRLGKVLQHLDGGVSVYEARTHATGPSASPDMDDAAQHAINRTGEGEPIVTRTISLTRKQYQAMIIEEVVGIIDRAREEGETDLRTVRSRIESMGGNA